MKRALAVFLIVFAALAATAQESPAKRIHVVVALCDNESQGIVKVGAKIGNGDDPERNLYWGCSDGLWRWFAASKQWTLEKSEKARPTKPGEADPWAGVRILETQTWKHRATGAILTAEAWRGREIRPAVERYVELLAADGPGSPDLVAWIGHNALMDFRFEHDPRPKTPKPRDAIVLCCLSRSYFSGILEDRGVRPILTTEQLMYPGAFLLDAAIEGWLKGEGRSAIRERAAAAYVKNQKIGIKAARGVFSVLE